MFDLYRGCARAGNEVFDYPVTAEQVKWLAKYRPAQPANGPGRAMPLAYLLDVASDSAQGVVADNSGTGTDAVYKWYNGYANWPNAWTGALGSQYAFHLNNLITFRVDNTSSADGLGASLDSGMTLSFWVKAPGSVNLWRDFLSLRIGNRYERFEWCASNPVKFTTYGAANGDGNVALTANTWQNVCMTWNPATSKMEFYLDGELTMRWDKENEGKLDITNKTFAPAPEGTKLLLGLQEPDSETGYYTGKLDDLAFYTVALDGGQVAKLFNDQK